MSTNASTPPADDAPKATPVSEAAPAADDKTLYERAEEMLEEAGDKIEEAFDATVEAAKKNPVAAGAIAAGAAAAVAGAVFGATKLFGTKDKDGPDGDA